MESRRRPGAICDQRGSSIAVPIEAAGGSVMVLSIAAASRFLEEASEPTSFSCHGLFCDEQATRSNPFLNGSAFTFTWRVGCRSREALHAFGVSFQYGGCMCWVMIFVALPQAGPGPVFGVDRGL